MRDRVRCAWNCLRGRPTCYRMTLGPPSVGMIVVGKDDPKTMVVGSTIRGESMLFDCREVKWVDA